ncbi:MAG: S1 family peptidase [Phycisphaerales bacterium JB040]
MHRNTTAVSVGALSLTLLAGGVRAGETIVIRHDVDDARYIALAKGHDSVAFVGGGTGTLIAPRWMLTAAHVADSFGAFLPEVTLGGETFTADLVLLHPAWTDGSLPDEQRPDLALVRLDRPVTGVTPSPLYRGSDEAGQVVTFVGGGVTGNGRDGLGEDDRVMRGAHNLCESVEYGHWLTFLFDAPNTALELEGISGPGDSGGPAFIGTAGGFAVAGVSSSNSGSRADGTHCTYGTTEVYARVSSNLEWLESAMREHADSPAPGNEAGVDLADGAWPDGAEPAMALALIEAWNAGDRDALTAFERTYRPTDPRNRSVEERAENWAGVAERFGTLTPLTMIHEPGRAVHVRCRSTNQGTIALSFEIASTDPVTMRGVLIR